MRQVKKRKKKYNRKKPYFRPEELKGYKRQYLKERELMPFLVWMYNSLDDRILKTELTEAPDKRHSKHKVRENKDTNPLWYRNLCSLYLEKRTGRKAKIKSNRKPKFYDTKIRAIQIQKALRNLIKKGYSQSLYFEDYIRIAGELKNQYTRTLELREDGEPESVIMKECELAYDLLGINMEIDPKEGFSVAEGFPDSCDLGDLEHRITEEDIPF